MIKDIKNILHIGQISHLIITFYQNVITIIFSSFSRFMKMGMSPCILDYLIIWALW
jgi:hypothetical protein